MSTLESEISELIEKEGYWLLDFKIRKGRSRSQVIAVVDHIGFEKPIGLDDCERISLLLEGIVETSLGDIPFDLEITSPGEKRPLKTEAQRLLVLGSRVSVHFSTKREIMGNFFYKLTGKLVESKPDSLRLLTDDKKDLEISLDGSEKVIQMRDFKFKV